MKTALTNVALPLLLLTGLCSHPDETQQINDEARRNPVVAHAGEFLSPGGKCGADLETSNMGGFLVLSFKGKATPKINDVTGIAWVSPDTLVYTASPVYGRPGVYAYNCDSTRIKRLVAPKNISKAYPDGADYFELERVSKGELIAIYYYYARDVDTVDVKKLRTPDHLIEVRLSAKQLDEGLR